VTTFLTYNTLGENIMEFTKRGLEIVKSMVFAQFLGERVCGLIADRNEARKRDLSDERIQLLIASAIAWVATGHDINQELSDTPELEPFCAEHAKDICELCLAVSKNCGLAAAVVEAWSDEELRLLDDASKAELNWPRS